MVLIKIITAAQTRYSRFTALSKTLELYSLWKKCPASHNRQHEQVTEIEAAIRPVFHGQVRA